MGYAMRTRRYRFIEWLNFTNTIDNKPTKGHHKVSQPLSQSLPLSAVPRRSSLRSLLRCCLLGPLAAVLSLSLACLCLMVPPHAPHATLALALALALNLLALAGRSAGCDLGEAAGSGAV